VTFGLVSLSNLLSPYLSASLFHRDDFFHLLVLKKWKWPVQWLQCCSSGRHPGPLRVPRAGSA
jgi:hypothetical protein